MRRVIRVSEKTWYDLHILKVKYGLRSMDFTLRRLLQKLYNLQQSETQEQPAEVYPLKTIQ